MRRFTLLKCFTHLNLALLFAVGTIASASSNSGITYQGRILKPDGSPLSGANTQFKLQIRTPDAQNCLMYEEIQALNMTESAGQFSLTLNDGSGSRTDTTTLTLDRIFANQGTLNFSPSTCDAAPGTYTPNSTDGRNLVVLFKDETMSSWEPIPAQKINFVPFAFEAKQVAGFPASSLFRVVNASGDPLTGLAPLSNAQYSALLALSNGTSTAYAPANTLAGVTLPTLTAGKVLQWNGLSWDAVTVVGGANSVTQTMIQNGAISTNQLANNVSISTSGNVAAASLSSTGSVAASTSVVTPQIYGSSAASGVVRIDGTSNATAGSVLLASSGGNVGIGTTSPLTNLEVMTTGTTASTEYLPGIFDHSSQIGVGVGFLMNAAGTQPAEARIRSRGLGIPMAVGTATNRQSLYILDSGYVGIGTTSPINRFSVLATWSGLPPATGTITTAVVRQAGAGSGLSLDSGVVGGTLAAGWLQVNQPGDLSQAGTMLLNPNGGNVGIGTTSPGSRFTVSGTIESTSGGVKFPDATTQSSATDSLGRMIVWDQEPTNTACPDAITTSGVFATRTINTVSYNSITSASLASNQITLPAGTYLINAKAPGSNIYTHYAVFYNVTDSVVAISGSVEKAAGSSQTSSEMLGVITLTSAKVFEVRQTGTNTGPGFTGVPNPWGPGIFTRVEIQKMK